MASVNHRRYVALQNSRAVNEGGLTHMNCSLFLVRLLDRFHMHHDVVRNGEENYFCVS